MDKLESNIKKIINKIKTQTNENPDIIIREANINDVDIAVVFSESLSDKVTINDYILEFLENLRLYNIKIHNLYEYIEQNITSHKNVKINNYKDLFYNIFSGFTVILINGYEVAIGIETRAKLDSGIAEAQNETVTKGPKDAFTENYQTNVGLIRKRIKTTTLMLEEFIVGSKSKTKIGIMYDKDITPKELVKDVTKKIEGINTDAIFDSNYVIEMISSNENNVFPNYLSTERPDFASMNILEGRIVIIVENTPYVVIVPTMLIDFLHTPEDYYQKSSNIVMTRLIRFIALLITILIPAIYVAISTYNLEAIPANLLLNFSIQREGVPLPTTIEIIMMIIVFEILKETDTRAPSAFGSSLSIVGALVLGQAAVAAGIVSPITIIVVAVSAISGLIAYSADIVNGIRWWRLIFIVAASIAGLFGVLIAGLFFTINLCSIKSFGMPYLFPFAPFSLKQQDDALFITNKRKFKKRKVINVKPDEGGQSNENA